MSETDERIARLQEWASRPPERPDLDLLDDIKGDVLFLITSWQVADRRGPRERVEVMNQSTCCFIGCDKAAKFTLYGSSGHPEDYTEACTEHVGILLGTPTWLAHNNTSWFVVSIWTVGEPLPASGAGTPQSELVERLLEQAGRLNGCEEATLPEAACGILEALLREAAAPASPVTVQPEKESFTMGDPTLQRELERVLNSFSAENGSNTPDFLLAQYLLGCLAVYDAAVKARDKWYGVELRPAPSIWKLIIESTDAARALLSREGEKPA